MSTIDEQLKQGFEDTYQAIAYDLGGFESANHSITREDLFSICLDHLQSYGDLTTEVTEYWEELTFSEKMKYETIVFPDATYEVGGA